jgi:hypothetical protein
MGLEDHRPLHRNTAQPLVQRVRFHGQSPIRSRAIGHKNAGCPEDAPPAPKGNRSVQCRPDPSGGSARWFSPGGLMGQCLVTQEAKAAVARTAGNVRQRSFVRQLNRTVAMWAANLHWTATRHFGGQPEGPWGRRQVSTHVRLGATSCEVVPSSPAGWWACVMPDCVPGAGDCQSPTSSCGSTCRSQYGFCQGAWGAINTPSMPMPPIRFAKYGPKRSSRSRSR